MADRVTMRSYVVDYWRARGWDHQRTTRMSDDQILAIYKSLKGRQDQHFYIQELNREECHCGAGKRRGHSFCFKCYRRLPAEMQRALYRRMGQGYEKAYDRAFDFLTD